MSWPGARSTSGCGPGSHLAHVVEPRPPRRGRGRAAAPGGALADLPIVRRERPGDRDPADRRAGPSRETRLLPGARPVRPSTRSALVRDRTARGLIEALTGYTPAMRRSGGRPRRRSSVGRLPIMLRRARPGRPSGCSAGSPAGLPPAPVRAADKDEVTIVGGEPAELDPALQSDIASARVSAQLFESLTAIDPSLTVRPALAESWDILDGGRRIVFHLRPGQTFSDGSPLGAADVVRSWLRVIDPKRPSPLASLMADVEGAIPTCAGRRPTQRPSACAPSATTSRSGSTHRPATSRRSSRARRSRSFRPGSRRGRGAPAGQRLRRQRRVHPRGLDGGRADADGQRALLGRHAGDRGRSTS